MRALAITTLRNEGAFLLEWLAHHRAVGFTDFLVFSNDCQDGSDAMLDRLAALGWLTHLPNPGPHEEGPQWAALKQADRHPLTRAADWILTFDIDEFVNIHIGDHSLSALCAALPEAGAIPLTWRLFGNGGQVAFEDRPVTESFTRAAPRVLHWPWRALMFKTFFRNDGGYRKLGVHRPRSPDPARVDHVRWFDGSGRELPATYRQNRLFSDPGADHYGLAQLNHYPLGAMESYLVKADRGRANRAAGAFDMGYWVDRNFDAEADLSIAALFPARAAIEAELRADPVLGTLHDAAVAWRRTRFAELMAEEPWRALFGRLLLSPPSRILSPEEAAMIRRHIPRDAETKI
ncbi:glycosyltransferase family 2 protein [Thioclava sp. BHET1]|nr:glycosyltransferase family 2 protein [Thioclava sp. BHET1]